MEIKIDISSNRWVHAGGEKRGWWGRRWKRKQKKWKGYKTELGGKEQKLIPNLC